jgi:hypothetical protein
MTGPADVKVLTSGSSHLPLCALHRGGRVGITPDGSVGAVALRLDWSQPVDGSEPGVSR